VILSIRSEFRGLSLHRMCQISGVPRSALYRKEPEEGWVREAVSEIQRLVTSFTGYGYRRVSRALKASGFPLGERRVRSLMREHGLCLPKPRRLVGTTRRCRPACAGNLCKGFVPQGPNQLWVTDLTGIRTVGGGMFLASILDAHSRKVVAWHLSRHADGELAETCLRKALEARRPPAGWIHHSDQGSVYTSARYVQMVRQAGGRLSYSGVGKPRENAIAESFFKTLKQEEVLISEYRSHLELETALERYIDGVYNAERMHSSIGYRSPDQFEALYSEKEGR